MSLLKGAVARLGSVLQRRRTDARMEEEFRYHIERETEAHIARGVPPAEARRRARLAFGAMDTHGEEMRDARPAQLMMQVGQDVRYALRSLRRSPAFGALAIFIVALGIGATTALFSIANALLFRPLRVSEPSELYMVQEVRWGAVSIGSEGRRVPYTRYEAYRTATAEVFDDVAAHSFRTFSLRTDAGAVPAYGTITSPNYFDVLGLKPLVGRFFEDEHEPAVVLSQRFWSRHFGGDPNAVGQPLYLDGKPYRVAGVAPPRFDGTIHGVGVDVWVPFRGYSTTDVMDMSRWVGMFGRMADGVSRERAGAVVDAVAKRIPPDEEHTRIERAYVTPVTGIPDGSRGDVAAFMGMLLGTASLVLLIASANIAGMLLARGVARRREIAVRLSIGAGRGRLIRQLLTESLVLFLLGAAGGVLLAWGAMVLISRISIPGLPLVLDFMPDLRVLAFALGMAATTGVLFGLAPALRASRADLVTALKGVAGAGGGRTRSRNVFVGFQIALAALLLVTAGLFVRGLQSALRMEPGFDADGVVIASVDVESRGWDEEKGRQFYDELVRRIGALPGVESVALAQVVLLGGNQYSNDVSAPDAAEKRVVPSAQNVVDAGYFTTLRVPIVAGRGFTAADRAGGQPVVVVNETLARRLWEDASPLGRTLRRGDTDYQVVGVVRDGLYVELNEAPRAFAFYAAAQEYSPDMTLHVRGAGADGRLVELIRREVNALDPDIALEQAMPLSDNLRLVLLPQRVAAGFVGLFGVLGLLLAAAGVYGVVSYQVAQRMREFGIRIALGAASRDLLRSVLGRGALVAATGAAAGLLLAAGVTRLLSSFLFGVSPLDPLTFTAVGGGLVAVALLASYLPARRALRADPVGTLRSE